MVDDQSYHALSIEETFARLESSENGLDTAEVQKRLENYGPNKIETEGGVIWLNLLLHQFRNPLVLVLVIAAVVAFLAGETIDTIVIAVVIVLNTLVGFFQEYRAESALEALRSQAAPEAEIVRCNEDGECSEDNIPADEVVPGDVIILNTGNRVPADARLISAINLKIDEAMLTGESLPVEKTTEPLDEGLAVSERTNLAYSGTVITEGRGKAVVFGTGSNTQMGEIATLIQKTEKAISPLQEQTQQLGKTLGIFAVLAGAVIFVLGLYQNLEPQILFLFVIAAVVSAIPEGLPAVMTITLAVGVNRMAKRNAIIRRLQAVDTLGATTVICTDKTGTLTTNQMTVQKIYAAGKMIRVSGGGFDPEGTFEVDDQAVENPGENLLGEILKAGALANDSRLVENQEREPRWSIRGDPTEGALIAAAKKAGLEKSALEKEYPRIDEVPFSSENKYMATFHETPVSEVVMYVKGAPETILSFSTRIQEESGETRELDDQTRQKILDTNTQMAGDALRVLAAASQTVETGEVESQKSRLKEDQAELVFLGLFGMMDPPRPEVEDAVYQCKKAGIRVIMATGDHKITGEAIARRVGILENDTQKVFSGPEVDQMSEEEMDRIIEDTRVFARVSPGHKQRIVASLQRQGHVVAMTGDGVNDAPALKGAEIGVAMGITGTDVTKETAEMVLTDDNFASIVSAAEEGRVVFQNVRKVVKFLVATNAGEILTILGAMIILPTTHLIFTPVQVLWVNLVTDGLLDITIALEPKEGDVMNQPPRKADERIINREVIMNLFLVAVVMAAGTLWVYSTALAAGNADFARTMAFATIAMFQVFNSLNVRSRLRSLFQIGPFSNRYLVGAIILSVLLLYLATVVPFLQIALGTVALSASDWGLIVLVSSSVFIVDEVRKFIQRRKTA
jgi:P-type Ca2+ transporter type 2C